MHHFKQQLGITKHLALRGCAPVGIYENLDKCERVCKAKVPFSDDLPPHWSIGCNRMHGITIDPVSHVISLPFVIYIHTIDLAVLTDHTTLSNAIIKRNSTTTYRLNYLKRHTTKKHLQPIFQSFFKNNFQLIVQHSCSPDPCSSIYPHYLSHCSIQVASVHWISCTWSTLT